MSISAYTFIQIYSHQCIYKKYVWNCWIYKNLTHFHEPKYMHQSHLVSLICSSSPSLSHLNTLTLKISCKTQKANHSHSAQVTNASSFWIFLTTSAKLDKLCHFSGMTLIVPTALSALCSVPIHLLALLWNFSLSQFWLLRSKKLLCVFKTKIVSVSIIYTKYIIWLKRWEWLWDFYYFFCCC